MSLCFKSLKSFGTSSYLKIFIIGEGYNEKNENGFTIFKCAFCEKIFTVEIDSEELLIIKNSFKNTYYKEHENIDRIKGRIY